MPSTKSAEIPSERADWRSAGLLYFSRSFYFRRRFGAKVWRISLDAGFGCPNRDGTLGTTGCVFCNPESFSPVRRGISLSVDQRSIARQINQGVRRIKARQDVERFVAYFQPGTNTHGPIERLRLLYEAALAEPGIVGLIVGTRPDCVGDDVLDLLAELAGRTWLLVEYGLQSIHDRTLDWIGRGHHYDAFLDAVRRSRQRGLSVGAHVILGLPGESTADMRATARELARLEIDAVKLHNLHATRNTPLADWVASGKARLPSRDEYVARVADFLEELPPSCVIDRLVGDAPRKYLVAPNWCLEKSAVQAAIETELRRRGTWQGRKHRQVGNATP